MYKQGGFRNFAPVRVGEELDVNIEAVGGKGDGIAKVKGFVIFVPNVKKGDNVRIRVTKVLRKVGFGEVIDQGTETISEHKKGRKHKEVEEMEESEEMTETSDLNEMPEMEDTEDFGEES